MHVHCFPTAEETNANTIMTAYTGFETGSTGGNWSGYSAAAIATGGIAGGYSYNLSSIYTLVRNALPSTRQYIVSYWVHAGSVTVTTDIGAAAGTSMASYNGWTYYEHLLPANSTTATVSSTEQGIDP